MRIVFLYTEIAEYFMACCRELSNHGEVHVIRWPVNKEAPFKFANQQIHLYQKSDYTFLQLKQLVSEINPTVIVCSGWIDKDYLKIAKAYKGKIPTVMTCDTQWRGNLKQYVAVLLSSFTLLRIFSHAWVPGETQKRYVKKLGFKETNIQTNFYSCDINYFNHIHEHQNTLKKQSFPKRFLYVGRYYDFKGIADLWQAFIELQTESPNEWELWCLGIGDLEPVQHPKIKHFGFVQPNDLALYSSQTGVFVLPSRFESWGVVVHEFAASGFPLLLSSEVGAKEAFLHQNKNGFEFETKNIASLKEAMKKIIHLTEKELISMGEYSHQLAQQITPKKWVNNLLRMV